MVGATFPHATITLAPQHLQEPDLPTIVFLQTTAVLSLTLLIDILHMQGSSSPVLGLAYILQGNSNG